ncbi:DMT family transporter [Patescibacteria group bacterium]
MSKKTNTGPYFILLACLFWSLDGLLRRALYTLPAPVVVFWEHALGALLILPFFISRISEVKKLGLKDWLNILAIAFFSSTIATILYTSALAKINYIQFSVVVLLQQLQPIFGIFMAYIMLKEKITKNFGKYALLAIVGAYMVTFKDLRVNLDTGNLTTIAALMALGAAFFWGSATALSKYALNKVSNITATSLRFWLAIPMAFSFVFITKSQASLLSLSSHQWLMLLAISLSSGMVAMVIYYYGLKKITAKASAIYELFWPVSAIIIGILFLKEYLNFTQILGSIFILFSIYKIMAIKD